MLAATPRGGAPVRPAARALRKGGSMIPSASQDRPAAGTAVPDIAEHPADSHEACGDFSSATTREILARYAKAHDGRAALGVATSLVPYLALSVAMYFALRTSVLLTRALAAPTAAFLVRTFIVFHDCSHGSFTTSRRVNTWLG